MSTTDQGLDAQCIARICTTALTESGHPARVTDDPTRGLVARTARIGPVDEPALARTRGAFTHAWEWAD